MSLGWVGNSVEKTIYMWFNRSSLIFDRSSLADLHNKSYNTLNSNFTNKHTLSSLILDSKFWSWFANTLNIEVLIHLVLKVLESNKLPLWKSLTKHITKTKMLKVTNSPFKNLYAQKKIQPNYYLSVANVDSSMTELTYIFLKHSTNI